MHPSRIMIMNYDYQLQMCHASVKSLLKKTEFMTFVLVVNIPSCLWVYIATQRIAVGDFYQYYTAKGRKGKGCVWVVVHLVEWTQERLIKSDAVKPSKCHWQMEKYLDSVATCTPLHIRKQQVKSGHGVLTNVTFSDYVIINRTPSVYVIELCRVTL